MNIMGKKTRLRALDVADIELLRETVNDPNMEYMVIGWSFPISATEQRRWYESTLDDSKIQRFIIETNNDLAEPLGMMALTDLDWKNRSAGIGIKLFSNTPRRQGYATDALSALLAYVFDELQLHRIGLRILSTNHASRALYEKCGAKQEGVLRDAVFKQGAFIDVIYYGILKDDFDVVREK